MSQWDEILNFLEPKESPYCPEDPSLTQKVFLRSNAQEALFGGMAGGGKGLLSHLPVWTPFGSKRVGDISVGDQVINPEGGVSRVIAVHKRGFQPTWRVSFSDGAELLTDSDHLWRYRLSGKLIKRDIDWRICTAPQLGGFLEKSRKEEAEGKRPHWPLIPLMAAPAKFTVTSRNPDARWPVEPYALGVLLGDGCLTQRGVTFASVDNEIREQMATWAESVGCEIRRAGDCSYRVGPKERGSRTDDARDRLEKLGLMDKTAERKFVPDAYKVAPLEVRRGVLQGLMDTDGYVDVRGHASFTSVSKALAEDVQWLARSMGFKATITDRIGAYRDLDGESRKCQRAYLVTLTGRDASDVFRLKRKKERCFPPQQSGVRRVTSVERIPDAETVCFTIDHPNRLFVAGDGFVVTHNSSALLMSALQFVDIPGYNAMIFRRTFADLALPSAIMDRFIQWMSVYPEVRFNHSTYTATFPSGARIAFGYLNNKEDYLRYKGSELQYIGFDEVTEIRESDYRYMFSRLRRPAYGPLSQVPLRVRAASNPAPNWVRQRFIIEGKEHGRIFVPSSFHENPGVDSAAYQKSLAALDPVERRRLEFGDWFATNLGSMFLRENFEIVDPADIPTLGTPGVKAVRFWVFAASEESASDTDPDWTVGALCYYSDGKMYVVDIRRIRGKSDKVEQLVAQTAHEDGIGVPIRAEQEPGSAGKIVIDQYARYVVPQYDFQGLRSTGDKETRAQPYAAAVANGRILVARAPWLTDWLDEHASFPEACEHDDQVGATSGAFNLLSGLGGRWPKKAKLIL